MSYRRAEALARSCFWRLGGAVIRFGFTLAEGPDAWPADPKGLSGADLRALARRETRPRVAPRLYAIAHVLDGMSRAEAARLCGMERQALRDAMARFNADGLAGLVDRPRARPAGWHGAHALRVPDGVTLVPLPPYSPELNPVERVWLYLRERFMSHRLLDSYDAIVDACCAAWNRLTPERLRSLSQFPYMQQVNF